MKRYLTEAEKKSLLDGFKARLDELTNGKIEFSKTVPVSSGKINILYTPEAFSKSVRLVMSHATEIAWHCLVRRKEKDFEVYDVLVYPQTVGPAHVHVKMGRTLGDGQPKDPTKYYTDWYNEVVLNMPPEEEANLCGQCHSHVNMSTSPSSVDLAQQKEELMLKGGQGFYLFQIWNKRLEINTFLYDLENNILYEKEDVNIVVEEDAFVKGSHQMLNEPEPDPKKKEKSLPAKKGKDTPAYGADDYGYGYQWREMYGTNCVSFAGLWNFSITLKRGAKVLPLVVEAHNAQEADDLFYDWMIDNIDWIDEELDIADTERMFDFSVGMATLVSDDTPVDVTYEDLTGVCYE